MLDRNSVHLSDAIDLCSRLDDASVDMIFIDPPYNLTNLAWEGFTQWSEFWAHAKRILKNEHSPVLVFSQQPFTTDLIVSNRTWFRYEIVIEKSMPTGFLDANRRPLRCHENLLVFAERMPEYWPEFEAAETLRADAAKSGRASHYGKHRYVDWKEDGLRYPRDVWHFAQRDSAFKDTKTLHPTQKPIGAVEKAIRLFSQTGWLIFDCFCGSGTTAIAARNTGRDYIVGDSSPEYIEVTKKRLAEPYTMPLFVDEEKPIVFTQDSFLE